MGGGGVWEERTRCCPTLFHPLFYSPQNVWVAIQVQSKHVSVVSLLPLEDWESGTRFVSGVCPEAEGWSREIATNKSLNSPRKRNEGESYTERSVVFGTRGVAVGDRTNGESQFERPTVCKLVQTVHNFVAQACTAPSPLLRFLSLSALRNSACLSNLLFNSLQRQLASHRNS